MKGFEKERHKTPDPRWIKSRFYVLILLFTALALTVLISLNHANYLLENILPAAISLVNALIAYVVSKREQGERSYKDMMKHVRNWTIGRFIGMAFLLIAALVSGIVEPLPFIFSFIGFYIFHQVIEIMVLQKEAA